MSLLQRIVFASQKRLTTALRQQVNKSLSRAGFDGNGRHLTVGEALASLGTILNANGIELDSTLNSHLFQGSEGKQSLDVAFSNPEDPFSPVSINNSRLFFTWHTRENGTMEVIAYLS